MSHMPVNRKRILVTTGILIACFVGAVSVRWWRSRSDSLLIANLLKVEALPRGTRIVEIRKDLIPDTLVEAHLIIPAGTVDQLVVGIPLAAQLSSPEIRYGIAMTKCWAAHFGNADFWVKTDASGRHVALSCAID